MALLPVSSPIRYSFRSSSIGSCGTGDALNDSESGFNFRQFECRRDKIARTSSVGLLTVSTTPWMRTKVASTYADGPTHYSKKGCCSNNDLDFE